MKSDRKKATSWIYTLKKEDLILELERRGLSIEGSFDVLRERLLRAERDDETARTRAVLTRYAIRVFRRGRWVKRAR